jgi:hypothetical protein
VSAPILPHPVLELLGLCVRANYGSRAVADALGLAGQAALGRSDLAGAERLTRGGSATETLIRLFLLGLRVDERTAAAALAPLPTADAIAAGLLIVVSGSEVVAGLDLRPYSEADGPDWWLLSDLGSDVRPGPLHPEHVLGVGQAATTLAQATIRRPVRRALDLGTGSGVQALHLSGHCESVSATDLSGRALSFAAANAALNELDLQLRRGSLLEPVANEQFDLIVCNPPFIVGPGFSAADAGFTYRDSGFASDSVCQQLISQLPGRLTQGGTAQLLANWVIDGSGDWQDRLTGWLPEHGVDAWIWQREVAEPGEYVALWLRDGGETPGTPGWQQRYDRWLDWFQQTGVAAVGMGLVNLRRTDRASRIVCQDVPQPYQPPIGGEVASWFDRAEWLARNDLLDARLIAAPDLVCTTKSLLGAQGWQPALSVLSQAGGMRWEVETDDAVAGLVAACSGTVPVGVLLDLVASSAQIPSELVATALLPVVHDLIERGFLVPDVLWTSAADRSAPALPGLAAG